LLLFSIFISFFFFVLVPCNMLITGFMLTVKKENSWNFMMIIAVILFSSIKRHRQSSSGNLPINRLIVLLIIQIVVVINQYLIQI
jgi:hypothetical protein